MKVTGPGVLCTGCKGLHIACGWSGGQQQTDFAQAQVKVLDKHDGFHLPMLICLSRSLWKVQMS